VRQFVEQRFGFLQVKILLNRIRDFHIRSFMRAFPSLAFSHQRSLHAWGSVTKADSVLAGLADATREITRCFMRAAQLKPHSLARLLS
jgi:hypothetical protein